MEPVAGKTGTTQNSSDTWFIAGTPDLVCGVWTGAEDRSVTAGGSGAGNAMPIWAKFMKKVYNDHSIKLKRGEFERPENFPDILLDCNAVHGDELLDYEN